MRRESGKGAVPVGTRETLSPTTTAAECAEGKREREPQTVLTAKYFVVP